MDEIKVEVRFLAKCGILGFFKQNKFLVDFDNL
jgi:hypothetical protein